MAVTLNSGNAYIYIYLTTEEGAVYTESAVTSLRYTAGSKQIQIWFSLQNSVEETLIFPKWREDMLLRFLWTKIMGWRFFSYDNVFLYIHIQKLKNKMYNLAQWDSLLPFVKFSQKWLGSVDSFLSIKHKNL